jgi:hypothetical protein
MASSPEEVAKTALAEYELMLFSSDAVQLFPDNHLSTSLQQQVIKQNARNLRLLGWDKHYNFHDGPSKGVIDKEGTLYLALIQKQNGKKVPVAQCKIAPAGEVMLGMANNHFEIAAEQLVGSTITKQVLALYSGNHHENDDDVIETTDGVNIINPLKEGGELIQFFGDPENHPEYALLLLLGAYLIGTYPKDSIEQLNMPSFQRMRNPTQEDIEKVERAKEFIKNIFKLKFFYGTSDTRSIPLFFIEGLHETFKLCFVELNPNGLDSYMSKLIQKNNPYRILKVTEDAKTKKKKHEYIITDSNNSKKWVKHTHRRWKEIYTLWQSHMQKSKKKGKDPEDDYEAFIKKAHDAFIRKVSEKTSVSDYVSQIVGIDPIPLGPNVLDPNLDPDHPYPIDSYQLCLYPPLAVPVQYSLEDPHHFGSIMFMKMCSCLKEEFGIRFSEVPLVNASLQRFFPDGYEEAFYEKELHQARGLEDHLLPSRLREIELAKKEQGEQERKGKKPNDLLVTDYRQILTPERRSSARFYQELIARMQGPNNNNDGR